MSLNQSREHNRRLVLASRPKGAPSDDNFRLEQTDIPSPADGQVLLRTVFLSLDPYMRGRMSDAPSYAEPVAIDDVMVGGTVNRVVESKLDGFSDGDWVLSYTCGWQDYALSDGTMLINLGKNPTQPSMALGLLGMPGFTAYMGLLDIGAPREGETLVVAAATGPVGATVGQIGKLKGCRVVGVAGGAEKCDFAVNELGFDACIDHYADDFDRQLAAACEDGIDVYFENVGGKIMDQVIARLNDFSRMPLCGLISTYNATEPVPGPYNFSNLLMRRTLLKGFIVIDYFPRFPEGIQQMAQWLMAGKIKFEADIVDGLENAPASLSRLFEGKNLGKLMVKVSEPPAA
ncbi:NADP-dependent oxidoreductase [uncultured Microbulbifer sp.]|uniref:NADP-dependent oxidoreductase n=1 Tax=uncultured Microbulbifer sp. TaxID=348147 RepID=UPI0025D806E1|nr:NADP-dependent oxidoreductase [uncultured Microbulbifer sp.]